MEVLSIVCAAGDPRSAKQAAEECCAFINALVGYEAATPAFCRMHRRHTGGVRITDHGMRNLVAAVFLGDDYAQVMAADSSRRFVANVWTP
jgi:hypothetical protein